MKKQRFLHLAAVLALGLGLVLGLLWALGSGATPVTAAPQPRPLQGPGDVYCVAPISQTYAGCTRVFTCVQYAMDAAIGGEVIKVAEGTYTDVHQRSSFTQVIYLDKSVTVRGGYTTTNNFAEPPYPITQPTTLDAGGQGRVIYINNVTATLESLCITNGVISGSVSDRGGGIYALSPHFVISDCHICNNAANNAGGGVWIQSDAATLVGNEIYSNTAKSGGGIRFNNSTGATLTGNRVHDNATTKFGGGGISFNLSPDATLTDNLIYSNTASMSGAGIHFYQSGGPSLANNLVCSNTAQNAGGGIYLSQSPTATLSSNEIYNNAARNNQPGGGVYLYGSYNITLTHNRVYSNTGGSGGGIYLKLSYGATIADNEIYSNTTTRDGGGVYLTESPTATLTSNIVHRNRAARDGGGVYLGESSTSTLASNIVYSNTAAESLNYGGGGIVLNHGSNITMVNNIIVGNRLVSGDGLGAGILVDQSDVGMLHTTLARNAGGDGSGVYVFQAVRRASAALTNTILVSHTRGIVTSGCTATLEATLWGDGAWANVTDTVGSNVYTGTLNWWGDPAFVDPDGDDYHVTGASKGRDVATDTIVIDDVDGDARPFGAGPDIGADEAQCHVRMNNTYYPTVQAAVDASAASSDVVQVAGACRGMQTRSSSDQVAYITKTLTIRGGYSPDFVVWDPDIYLTTLDAQGQGRVVRINGSGITPTIESLALTNGQVDSWGGGVFSRFASPVISGCRVYSNTSTSQSGGGIFLSSGSKAVLVSNRVHSNTTTSQGGGLYVYRFDEVTMTGNEFRGNTAGKGGGIYLQDNSDVMLTNNVIADNGASDKGSGVYVLKCSPRLLHNTIARNNQGEGSGVYLGNLTGEATVFLTNTILVSHTVGITVTDGNTATLERTLWGDGAWSNGVDWGGAGHIDASGDRTGDPSFVDPDGGDYHVTGASAAVDQGLPTWVSTDIDGDLRTIGSAPDLGADEAGVIITVTKDGPDWANEGESIVYTLCVTNSGVITAESVVLTDSLPAGANFISASDEGSEASGVVSWPVFNLLPNDGAVARTFTVTATEAITNDDYAAAPQGLPGVRGMVVVTTYVNHAPVADADATPDSLHSGTVTLDGSGSSDSDGDPLSYLWQQTGGSVTVSLTDADTATATFDAPLFGGVYTFTLTVSDTYGAADGDDTTVTVNLPALSVSKFGPSQADPGEPVTYTLTVANNSSTAASSLVITDALPVRAHFVSVSVSGVRVGDVVSWTAASLGGMGQIQRTFTVTATETITNADYRVSCAEGVSAVGSVAVVTEIEDHRIYLPLVLRSS